MRPPLRRKFASGDSGGIAPGGIPGRSTASPVAGQGLGVGLGGGLARKRALEARICMRDVVGEFLRRGGRFDFGGPERTPSRWATPAVSQEAVSRADADRHTNSRSLKSLPLWALPWPSRGDALGRPLTYRGSTPVARIPDDANGRAAVAVAGVPEVAAHWDVVRAHSATAVRRGCGLRRRRGTDSARCVAEARLRTSHRRRDTPRGRGRTPRPHRRGPRRATAVARRPWTRPCAQHQVPPIRIAWPSAGKGGCVCV